MKKIMLVDDELDILYGFQLMLNWEALGFEIIALCLDGYEAIEILEKALPDIIITDIRMAGMDGLELGKYVAEHYPQIKLIVLSSYSEYTYMKTAIDLKVSSYLLKPLDEDQLKSALCKAAEEIDAATRQLHQMVSRDKQVSGAVFFVACSKLISGNQLEEYEEQLLRDKLSLHKPRMLLAEEDMPHFSGFDSEERADLFYKTLSIGIHSRATMLFSRYLENRAVFVFSCDDYDRFQEELDSFCQRNMSTTFSAVVSEVLSSPEEIPTVYTAAKAQLQHEMFFGLPGSYYLAVGEKGFTVPCERIPSQFIDECKIELEKAIVALDDERVDEAICGILSRLRKMKQQFSEQEARVLCAHLGNHALTVLEREVHPSSDELEELRFNLMMTHNLYNLETILEKISDQIERLIQTVGKHPNQLGVLQPVMEYLQNHYAQQISLDGVAKLFYLNPSYLSRLFTKTLGVTFTTYLTDIRITAARQMLDEQKLSVSEIAQACGYNSDSSFYSAFKKTIGYSPGEYRRLRRR